MVTSVTSLVPDAGPSRRAGGRRARRIRLTLDRLRHDADKHPRFAIDYSMTFPDDPRGWYPAALDVVYPDHELDRLTTFFRPLAFIPIPRYETARRRQLALRRV